MQTKTIYALSVIVTAIALLIACRKSDSTTGNPGPNPPTPGTLITGSVAGRVTDINNAPVSNATVTAGTSTTTTDVNGQFSLNNVQFNKDAGFVKVTKTGYFEGSRTFLVNSHTVNNVKIQLIPKTVSGNFTGNAGGNINVSGGGSVNFDANSIKNATTGAAYAGNVSVSTFYLNSSDANFNTYMPGNLLGNNGSNQQKILQSFGMVSVEMDGAVGNKLQIATGKTATLTIPIPSAMLAGAPANLPLWYFNDTTGIWKQEGSATKQGSNYVGTVAHFSFWTPGQLQQSVRLDASFKNQSGTGVVNYLVTITSANSGTTSGYTDSAGAVSGLIPAGETLWLRVIASCGLTIDSMNIGPYSNDTNLGTVTVDNVLSNSVSLSGTVVNCSNMPVSNGYVQVNLGSTSINSPITNGSFTITFSSQCSFSNGVPPIPPDSIIAYDVNSGQHGIPKSINGITGSQDIGQLVACATIPPATPVANFTYTTNGNSTPVTITFTNISTNATGYLWDFGDGSTSSLQDPSHTYTVAGDYSVQLTATGNGGTNSITAPIHISGTVNNGPDSSYVNLTLNGTAFSWAFPDSASGRYIDTTGGIGPNSTLIQAQNTNSIYFYIFNDNASAGNYNITLSALLNGLSYPNNNTTTTVTEYGMIGGYIGGTAYGQMRQLDSTTNIPFTLSYRVKRLQ